MPEKTLEELEERRESDFPCRFYTLTDMAAVRDMRRTAAAAAQRTLAAAQTATAQSALDLFLENIEASSGEKVDEGTILERLEEESESPAAARVPAPSRN